jgi:hypothetical protein
MHDHNIQTGRFGPIEWATAGRPHPGEHVSGDQPIAVEIDAGAALFGVLDGLGHGAEAAAAAVRAVDTLKDARAKRLEVLVQLCHRVLGGTRGVAMTLARVDFAEGTLAWTGVGNVCADLVAKSSTGIQRPPRGGHRRLPHSRNPARTSRPHSRRRPDRHRHGRCRRGSPAAHRFRGVRHRDRQRALE